MAGGKQSARQKMINLMYLVFIAMMALNIDREVLRSFENVNNSLFDATELSSKNNEAFYQVIAEKAKKDVEYQSTEIKAKAVQVKSDELYNIITDIKTKLDIESKYVAPTPGQEVSYASLQDNAGVNKLFFISGGKPSDLSIKLEQKISEYKDFMLKQVDKNKQAHLVEQINQSFNTSPKGNISWIERTFFEQPMIAAKTNLTKLQSDIRTVEGNLARSFFETKLLADVELKAFQGVIMAPVYLAKGENGSATVALGAFDNGIKGTATINGNSYPLVDGKATIPLGAANAGKYTLSGSIAFVDKSGKSDKVDIAPAAYEVVEQVLRDKEAEPVGVVSADRMNVVYRGLPNPISASMTGVSPSSVSLSATGGSLSKSSGGWILTPSSGSEAVLTVSGKTEKGASFSKPFKFRIKNVPAPQGQIRGLNTISLPATSFGNQLVEAKIPEFEFDVKFQVTSCKVKVSGKPTLAINGNDLAAAKGLVTGLRSGDVVNIFDIQVVATGLGDQRIKNVSPIAVTIQ